MARKSLIIVLLAVTVVGVGAVGYFFSSASDPCRNLEAISKNEVVRDSLAKKLASFINSPSVMAYLESRLAGRVFNLSEFDQLLPVKWGDVGIPADMAQLVVITNRTDNRFVRPFEVRKVGIGYARAYLMFNRRNSNGSSNGKIVLDSSAYVDCKVYED